MIHKYIEFIHKKFNERNNLSHDKLYDSIELLMKNFDKLESRIEDLIVSLTQMKKEAIKLRTQSETHIR